MKLKSQIMNEEDINRTLIRLAHQILEKNTGAQDICLIGIKTRGVPLAQRIADNIEKIEHVKVETGVLDITLYRDDLSKITVDPVVSQSHVPFSIEDRTVILVDDVIFTGRTARAALDALMALGRPRRVQLVELIDRGHSELPIRANYVGKNIPTSLNEVVSVHLQETDGVNDVVIYEL